MRNSEKQIQTSPKKSRQHRNLLMITAPSNDTIDKPNNSSSVSRLLNIQRSQSKIVSYNINE